MRKNRLLTWIIGLADVALIAAVIFMYIEKDKTAPAFAFSDNDAVYEEGMDTGLFMTGVTASDNVDGNVTDRIIIEKITTNRQQGIAVVYYAVSDSKGNVARASREFAASFEK